MERTSIADFCARIGIDAADVDRELGDKATAPGWHVVGKPHESRCGLDIMKPARWVAYSEDERRSGNAIIKARFNVYLRPIDEPLAKNVEFTGDSLDEVLEYIAGKFPKAQPAPDLYHHVFYNGSAYVLNSPFLLLGEDKEDARLTASRKRRVMEEVKRHKRLLINRSLARSFKDVEGVRVGEFYWHFATPVYKTNKKYKKPVKLNEVTVVAEKLAVELRKAFGDIGKFINFFGKGLVADKSCEHYWRRPKKSEYAEFIVTGMKLAKVLGCDVKTIIVALKKLPHESLLKDKDEKLKDLGKLVQKLKKTR